MTGSAVEYMEKGSFVWCDSTWMFHCTRSWSLSLSAIIHRPWSIALRVLTLVEFVVRRQLAQEGASLAGLYAGNPKRATTHPTTERLLEACQEITLTLVIEPHQTRRHVTALSPLQQRVLALLDFTPTIYTKLCGDSSEPP